MNDRRFSGDFDAPAASRREVNAPLPRFSPKTIVARPTERKLKGVPRRAPSLRKESEDLPETKIPRSGTGEVASPATAKGEGLTATGARTRSRESTLRNEPAGQREARQREPWGRANKQPERASVSTVDDGARSAANRGEGELGGQSERARTRSMLPDSTTPATDEGAASPPRTAPSSISIDSDKQRQTAPYGANERRSTPDSTSEEPDFPELPRDTTKALPVVLTEALITESIFRAVNSIDVTRLKRVRDFDFKPGYSAIDGKLLAAEVTVKLSLIFPNRDDE